MTDITKEQVFKANKITPEKEKEFMKNLRLALRFDYDIPAKEVRKMNDDKVIEVWYEIHNRPENQICGQ